MAEFSHYLLRALRQQPLKREYWAHSLSIIMNRLNGLEMAYSLPLSNWYQKDNSTGTEYGNPEVSKFPHMRITWSGSPKISYLRDRIDLIREHIDAPAFEWTYTPSKEDYENATNKCGIDARQLLEILQAIGREWGGTATSPLYVTHYKQTLNGVVTEWETPASRIAYASYYLAEGSRAGAMGSGGATWRYDLNYGTQSSEVDEYEIKTDGLQTTTQEIIGYSIPSTQATLYLKNNATYDWVETEGRAYVMLLNSGEGTGTSGGTEKKFGQYQYIGDVYFHVQASCYGGRHTVGQGIEQTAIIDLEPIGENRNTVLGRKFAHFTPEFTVGSDGSVYPVVPSDLPIGSLSEDASHYGAMLSEATSFLDAHRAHTTVSHLMSVIVGGYTLGGNYGEVDFAGGGASCSAHGFMMTSRTVVAEYKRTGTIQNQRGWLLWKKPYIPVGYGGWPVNLKDAA